MPSLTFATDKNNDFYLDENGNIAMATGQDAIKFVCEQITRTLQGELIYHTDEGLPYVDSIWSNKASQLRFQAALRAALEDVPEVIEVNSISTELEKDVFKYEVVLRTVYGQVTIFDQFAQFNGRIA